MRNPSSPKENTGNPASKCPSFADMTRYVTATLTQETRTAIEQHIPLCPQCQQAQKALEEDVEKSARINEEIDALSFDQLVARVHDMQRDPDFNELELTALVERCARELKRNPHCDAAISILVAVTETPLFKGTAGYEKAGKIVHEDLMLTTMMPQIPHTLPEKK